MQVILERQQEKIDQLLDETRRTRQALEELVGLLRLGAPQVVPQPAAMPVTVTPLPIDPIQVLKAVQAFGIPGEAFFGTLHTSWLVPAGSTTTVTVPVMEGHVGIILASLEYFSDYYSTDITGLVYVDEPTRIITAGAPGVTEAVITGPGRVALGQWYVVRRYVAAVFRNNTTVDATISIRADTVALQKSFYDEWFAPILRHCWEALNQIVVAMGGRPR